MLAVHEQSVELWHRRFGHLRLDGLNKLAEKGMVDGLTVTQILVWASSNILF